MKPAHRRWYRDGQLEREQAEYDRKVTEASGLASDGTYTVTLHAHVHWSGVRFLVGPLDTSSKIDP